jgi:hypothetical protein
VKPAALIERGRLNPGYLKLDLFCRGLRLAPDLRLDDGQGPARMRSGLGSGLELELPGRGRLRVNAPVVETFAARSPYVLEGPGANGRHFLTHEGRPLAPVTVTPRPRFLDEMTTSGKPKGQIGVMQGSYLGIYYGHLCANWKVPEEDACRFCSLGVNMTEGGERTGKTPADVLETVRAAQRECGITFVHINAGFDDRGHYLDRLLPLLEALRPTGLLTGVQFPPLRSLEDYRRVRAAGVNNVSLCFELWDPERFAEVCPGKARRASHAEYREAITRCAQELRFDTTNGEMIAGLEPVESSMRAVDWLTSVGAIPTICVFRPVVGTDYMDRQPPATEDLAPLFAHAWRRVMEHGLPIDIAPGIRVSIVLTPEEWRWLVPPAERNRYPIKRLRLAAMRTAYRGWRHVSRRHAVETRTQGREGTSWES